LKAEKINSLKIEKSGKKNLKFGLKKIPNYTNNGMRH